MYNNIHVDPFVLESNGGAKSGFKSLVRRKRVDSVHYKCSDSGHHQLAKELSILHLIAIGKLEQSDGNKKKGITMENVGHSRGVATGTRQVVPLPPSGETIAPFLKEFTYYELCIATMNFRKDVVIGEVGFERVFKAWLDSATFEPLKVTDKILVAIKKSKHESTQGLKEWQAELIFLGNLSHPNLVKLFGYCWKNEVYLLVYEYMQKGSLENHIFKKDAEPLTWETRIKIAIRAAQGLAFLHNTENNVICRNVKSSNILLDENFNAKLSDFGLAKLSPYYENTHVSTRVVGTYGYAAPEYIRTANDTYKSSSRSEEQHEEIKQEHRPVWFKPCSACHSVISVCPFLPLPGLHLD